MKRARCSSIGQCSGGTALAAVTALVEEVFAVAAGAAASAQVRDYLQSQRVTALADLQFLELSWLQEACPTMPPLLLNKFLSLANRRIGATY